MATFTTATESRGNGGSRASGRWRRPAVATAVTLALYTAFLVVIATVAWRQHIISDFGQHASAIERVKAHPLHPANPLLALPGTGSPYYSPLIVGLGMLARLTGLTGRAVLRGMGPVNLVLFLTGVVAFARTVSRDRWTPALALVATTVLWGSRPAAYSGFLSASAMSRNLDWPSAFAVAATLHLWALADRTARDGGSWVRHALLGLLTALIVLIHPITSVGAAIGLATIICCRQRHLNRAVAARWAVTVAAGTLLVVVWPYYDVFSLAGNTTVDPFQRMLYGRHLVTWYGLALAGVPALVARWRRDRRDPLVWMWPAFLAVAAYGWFSGHYTYGRVFGVLLLPPQFALTAELARAGRRTAWRRAYALVAAVAAAAGLLTQTAALIHLPFRLPLTHTRMTYLPGWPSYDWITADLRPGDLVLTDDSRAEHVLPAYGAVLVIGAWPDPSVPAAVRRKRAGDVRRYFAPGTPDAQRRAIAAHYGVRWILLGPGEAPPPGAVPAASSPATGELLARLGPAAGGRG